MSWFTTAVSLGIATGLRSMTGLAMAAQELSGRETRSASRFFRRGRPGMLERGLSDSRVAAGLTLAAAGEILLDKLPGMPDRITPGPLAGRMVIGGLLGGLAAREEDGAELLAGVATGAAAAAVGAYMGWLVRREVARATMVPDPAIALGEDVGAVALAREAAAEL